MKKIAVFIVLAFAGFNMQAQDIDLGVKAGVNFATLTDATNLKSQTGFVAGVFAGFKVSEKVGVQAELLYSQQGADLDLGEFDLDYVNVPLILKYFISGGLNLQVGPQFGFLVNDDISGVFGDIADQINANEFDVAGVVGVGFDFPMGIRLDGRYSFGLTDVPNIGSSKNAVFTLALGYSFL